MDSIILLSPKEDIFSVICQYVSPLQTNPTNLLLTKTILLSSDPKDMTDHSLLLINNDLPLENNLFLNTCHPVITYGCHPKSTVTASSICENRMVCCVQRPLNWKEGYTVEPQEIPVPLENCSISSTLGGICVLLLAFGESFFS